MGTIGQLLDGLAVIGSVVCFILVLIQMFQRGQTTMGIVCIVLAICCGLGGLVAFIFGWVNHRPWGITNVMIIWSACVVFGVIGGLLHPIDFGQFQNLVPR